MKKKSTEFGNWWIWGLKEGDTRTQSFYCCCCLVLLKPGRITGAINRKMKGMEREHVFCSWVISFQKKNTYIPTYIKSRWVSHPFEVRERAGICDRHYAEHLKQIMKQCPNHQRELTVIISILRMRKCEIREVTWYHSAQSASEDGIPCQVRLTHKPAFSKGGYCHKLKHWVIYWW